MALPRLRVTLPLDEPEMRNATATELLKHEKTPPEIRVLPYPLQFYQTATLHVLFACPWAALVAAFTDALKGEKCAVVKPGVLHGSRPSQDPTATYLVSEYDVIVWQISPGSNLAELVLLTDDALDDTWRKFWGALLAKVRATLKTQ